MSDIVYRIAKFHARRKFNYIDMVAQCALWTQIVLGNYFAAISLFFAVTIISVICEQATGEGKINNPDSSPTP